MDGLDRVEVFFVGRRYNRWMKWWLFGGFWDRVRIVITYYNALLSSPRRKLCSDIFVSVLAVWK